MKSLPTNNLNPNNREALAWLEIATKGLCGILDQIQPKLQRLNTLLRQEKEYLIAYKIEQIPPIVAEKEKLASEINELEL